MVLVIRGTQQRKVADEFTDGAGYSSEFFWAARDQNSSVVSYRIESPRYQTPKVTEDGRRTCGVGHVLR